MMPKKISTDYWQQRAAARQGSSLPKFDRTGFKESRIRSSLKDGGQSGIATKQAWMLFFLVMLWVARNTILLRRRSGDVYDALDTMAMLQVGIVFTIFIVLLLGPGRKLLAQASNTSIRFYFLYYFLGLLSALWSVNPAFSFYRALEVLALSMAVIVFCAGGMSLEENITRTRIIVWSTVLMLVAGTAHLASISNLRNNTLGAAAAMTASFFITWILAGREQKDRKRFIQGSIGVAIVLLSLSLASWWSFWFGICYFATFSRRKSLIFCLFVVGILIFFILGTDTRENLLVLDKTPDKIQTLTGRKMLWSDYWDASMDRPLTGFGFSVGAREVGSHYTTNTHNMFFGALLGLGWIGVGCWILFFCSIGTELLKFKHSRNPAWLACGAALAAGTLNSMSLSVLGEQWSVSTTVFVAFWGLHMSFLQETKKERQKNTDPSYRNKTSLIWKNNMRPGLHKHPLR